MIIGVTHPHLGPIRYRSEPSNVPSSPKQFLFFAISYGKTALGQKYVQNFVGFFGVGENPKLIIGEHLR